MTVSVIIPTWKRVEALEKAVGSALRQSVPPLEVLVCEDGCTKAAQRVAESFGDDRVRWLPGERAGRPAVPRNRGIRASRGAWLAFLDDDDLWHPQKLETQLAAAERHGSRAVCSDAWRIRPGGAPGTEVVVGGEDGRIAFADLLRENVVICSSMMVRREIVGITGGFPEDPLFRAFEDYALWLRVADVTGIAYVAQPLLEYLDAPATSIRNNGLTFVELKKVVKRNFIAWRRFGVRHCGNKIRALHSLISEK